MSGPMPEPQTQSIDRLWAQFLRSDALEKWGLAPNPDGPVDAIRFGDNEADVNECLHWVMIGQKRATSPSLWSIESGLDRMPEVGDLNVVLDWQGRARCVIETLAVEQRRYADVDEAYAWLEGEGDRSLAWWQRVHEGFYWRERGDPAWTFDPQMWLILERFRCVWPDSQGP